MREGGFNGGIFAVYIDPALEDPLGRTMSGIRQLRATLDAHPAFRLVLSASDLEREADDRIAAVIGVEGGYAIDDDLGVVEELFDAGMRCLTLTWNDPTTWADAADNEPHGGLTPFGWRLIDRLQRLGVLVDLSHGSDTTTAPRAAAASGVPSLEPLSASTTCRSRVPRNGSSRSKRASMLATSSSAGMIMSQITADDRGKP